MCLLGHLCHIHPYTLQTEQEEVPISLQWFVDKNQSLTKTTQFSNIQKDIRDEVKILQDKIQSMEENIKQLVTLLKDQRK